MKVLIRCVQDSGEFEESWAEFNKHDDMQHTGAVSIFLQIESVPSFTPGYRRGSSDQMQSAEETSLALKPQLTLNATGRGCRSL